MKLIDSLRGEPAVQFQSFAIFKRGTLLSILWLIALAATQEYWSTSIESRAGYAACVIVSAYVATALIFGRAPSQRT